MQLAGLANSVAFMCMGAALLIFWASATLFLDGLFHIVTMAACDRYSPGPVTIFAGIHPHFLAHRLGRFARPGPERNGVPVRPLDFIIWYSLFHFAI
jgi:hypothetical protein